MHDLVGDEYSVLGEYTNAITKIKVRHNTCGYEYNVRRNHFLNGRRCPNCSESTGETKIRRFLEEKKYIFSERI